MIALYMAAVLRLWPPVQVEVDSLALPEAEVQQLHGQLVTRLVEAGESVGRPGVIYLRVTGSGGVVRVEVQHGRHLFGRVVKGEGAVFRLAVIHAALDLLAALAESDAAADPALVPPAEQILVIDETTSDESLIPEAIEASLAAGLVVAKESEVGRRLCLERAQHGGWTVGVALVGEPCTPQHEVESLESELATVLAKVPHEELTAARDARTNPGPVEPVEPVDDEEEVEVEVDDEQQVERKPEPEPSTTHPSLPTPKTPAWRVGVAAGAGAQARLTSPEALIVLGVDVMHRTGPLLLFRGALSPSRAADLRVYDSFLHGGVGWRFSAGKRFSFHAGLAAGVALHAYSFPPRRGTRANVAMQLPMGAAVAIGRSFEIAVEPTIGWSTRARQHTQAGRPLWSRDRWRLGAAVTLRYWLPTTGNSKPPRRP